MSELKVEDLERIGLRDGVDEIYIEARFKDGQKFSIAEFPIECESICVEVFNFLNERIANEASTSKEQALNIGSVMPLFLLSLPDEIYYGASNPEMLFDSKKEAEEYVKSNELDIYSIDEVPRYKA